MKRKHTQKGMITMTHYYVYADKGTLLATYSRQECVPNTVYLDEHTLYGSKRLGVRNYPGVGQSNRVSLDNEEVPNNQILYKREIFSKHYEVSDHLGNVRAVIGDTKWDAGGGIFRPNVITYSNYYPFGMAQPGRNLNSADYKFGYNGKEKDDEIKGSGNSYDYGFRMYDPRVAKFLSIDPLAAEYPWYTPFQFAGNTPIQAIDLDGLEPFFIVGTNQTSNEHPVMRKVTEQILYTLYPKLAELEVDYGFLWDSHNFTLNNVYHRKEAAQLLYNYTIEHHKPGTPIVYIGFSHGFNVSLQTVKDTRNYLDTHGEKDTPIFLIGLSPPSFNFPWHQENPINLQQYFTEMHFFEAHSGSGGKDYTIFMSNLYEGADNGYFSWSLFPQAFPQLKTDKITGHSVDLTGVADWFSNLHSWIFDYEAARQGLINTGDITLPSFKNNNIWNEYKKEKSNNEKQTSH